MDTTMSKRFRHFLIKRLGYISDTQAIASFLVPRHKELIFCRESMKNRIISEITSSVPTTTITLSEIDAEYEGCSTKDINEVVEYQSLGTSGINCMLFWESNKTKFPKLYNLACKYLIMMGASAPSECAFSVVGRIQNTRRHMSNRLHENYVLAKELYKLEDIIAKYGT